MPPFPRPLAYGALGAVLLAAVACDRSSSSSSGRADRGGDTAATLSPTARYRPEVEEGLGISVAILVDNSGSMAKRAGGDARPKYLVAREAIKEMLAATDSLVARRPDYPVNVGLYAFSSRVVPLVPVGRYDPVKLWDALGTMPEPKGGTAIGDAMEAARADLYRAGTFRKSILVVTDGENTDGRSPRRVATEIAQRSENSVRLYFVAFDVDAKHFDFVRTVRGEVLSAADASALHEGLDRIYRGKILAEALDAGEGLPADSVRPAVDTTRRSQ